MEVVGLLVTEVCLDRDLRSPRGLRQATGFSSTGLHRLNTTGNQTGTRHNLWDQVETSLVTGNTEQRWFRAAPTRAMTLRTSRLNRHGLERGEQRDSVCVGAATENGIWKWNIFTSYTLNWKSEVIVGRPPKPDWWFYLLYVSFELSELRWCDKETKLALVWLGVQKPWYWFLNKRGIK